MARTWRWKDCIPSFVLLACCLCCSLLEHGGIVNRQTFGGCPVTLSDCMTYHFSHANIFHLAANTFALLSFRPRWSTLLASYLCATMAALLLSCATAVIGHPLPPTCGMSGILFAAFARRAVAWKQFPLMLLAVNFIFALSPLYSWQTHLVSFLISYGLWHLYYRQNIAQR